MHFGFLKKLWPLMSIIVSHNQEENCGGRDFEKRKVFVRIICLSRYTGKSSSSNSINRRKKKTK